MTLRTSRSFASRVIHNTRRIVASLMLALTSVAALALGMSEPVLHSQLGQKLNAEMELINMGDMTPEELAVSITHESGSWSPVKAVVSKRSDGKNVIKLRSSEVINEPYLEFTVVVRWPQGELRRQVTLLLDAP